MHLEATIERVLEIHLEAEDGVELRDALGGRDRAGLTLHLEAVM